MQVDSHRSHAVTVLIVLDTTAVREPWPMYMTDCAGAVHPVSVIDASHSIVSMPVMTTSMAFPD